MTSKEKGLGFEDEFPFSHIYNVIENEMLNPARNYAPANPSCKEYLNIEDFFSRKKMGIE